MAGGFDELIEFLLTQIAYAGENGISIQDFKDFVQQFYRDSHEASKEADDLADIPTPTVDDRLLEKVWLWLRDHDDIWVGQQREGNHLSLAQLQAQDDEYGASLASHNTTNVDADAPDQEDEFVIDDEAEDDVVQDAPQADTNHVKWRVFTSQDRIWQAVAGHGVDFTRVPRMEFEALCAIARAGSAGILQPDIVRITGQDKRSLPKRTDILASNGYIQKKVVYAKKLKTSHCLHIRYVSTQADEDATEDNRQGEIFRENHLVLDDFLAFLLQAVAVGDAIPISDFYLKIEQASSTKKKLSLWQKKSIRRCLERLDIIGITQRCRLRFAAAVGGKPRNVAVIRLLRPPGTEDLHKFHTIPLAERLKFRENLARIDNEARLKKEQEKAAVAERRALRQARKARKLAKTKKKRGEADVSDDEADVQEEPVVTSVPTAPEAMDDQSDGDYADEEDDQPISDIEDNDDEDGDQVEELERKRPAWDPDELHPNLLYRFLEAAGPAGLASQELKEEVFGHFYVRPLDNILSRLTNDWRVSQPQHIRHLGLIRDVASHTKQQQFLYRTHSNFQKMVDADEAEWSSILDKKARSTRSTFDQWGFPAVDPSEFVRTTGPAALAEAIDYASHRPSAMDEIVFRTDDGEWKLDLTEPGSGGRGGRPKKSVGKPGPKPGSKQKKSTQTSEKEKDSPRVLESPSARTTRKVRHSYVPADPDDSSAEQADDPVAAIATEIAKPAKKTPNKTKENLKSNNVRAQLMESWESMVNESPQVVPPSPQVVVQPPTDKLHLRPLPQSYDPDYYKIWVAKRRHQETIDKREAQILRYAEWLATQEVISKTLEFSTHEGPIPLDIGIYSQATPFTPIPLGRRKRGRPKKIEATPERKRAKLSSRVDHAPLQQDTSDVELSIATPLTADRSIYIQADRVRELVDELKDSSRIGVHVEPPEAAIERVNLQTGRREMSCVLVFRYPWLKDERWRRPNDSATSPTRISLVGDTPVATNPRSTSLHAEEVFNAQAASNTRIENPNKDDVTSGEIRTVNVAADPAPVDAKTMDCAAAAPTTYLNDSLPDAEIDFMPNVDALEQDHLEKVAQSDPEDTTAAAALSKDVTQDQPQDEDQGSMEVNAFSRSGNPEFVLEQSDVRAPLTSDILSDPLATSELDHIILSEQSVTSAIPFTPPIATTSPYSTRAKPRPSAKQAALLESSLRTPKPRSKASASAYPTQFVSRVAKRGRKKLSGDPSLVLKFSSPKVQAVLNKMALPLAANSADDPMDIEESSISQQGPVREQSPTLGAQDDASAALEVENIASTQCEHNDIRKDTLQQRIPTADTQDERRDSLARSTPKLIDESNDAGPTVSAPKSTPPSRKRLRLSSPPNTSPRQPVSARVRSRTASMSDSDVGRANKRKKSNKAMDHFRSLQNVFSSKTKMVKLRYNSSASSGAESTAEDSVPSPRARHAKSDTSLVRSAWRNTSGPADLDADDCSDSADSDEDLMQEMEQTMQSMAQSANQPVTSNDPANIEHADQARSQDNARNQEEQSISQQHLEPAKVRVVLDEDEETPKLIREKHAHPEDAYGLRKRVTDGINAQNRYRRKKVGVGMGGGTVKAKRLNVIVDIVRQAGGAFGGDNEIIRPFQNISLKQKMSAGLPDRDTIIRTMRAAVQAKLVKRVRWSFRDKCGVEQKRHLLILPELDKDSPAVGKMMEAIKNDWPNLHIPLALLGNQLRGRIDTKQAKQISRTVILLDADSLNADSVWVQEHRKRLAEMAAKRKQEEEDKLKKQQAEKERLAKLAATRPTNSRRPFKSIRDGLERPAPLAPVAKMQVSKEDQEVNKRLLRNVLPATKKTDTQSARAPALPRGRKASFTLDEPDLGDSEDETFFQDLYGSPTQTWKDTPETSNAIRPSAVTGVFRGFASWRTLPPAILHDCQSGQHKFRRVEADSDLEFGPTLATGEESDFTPRATARRPSTRLSRMQSVTKVQTPVVKKPRAKTLRWHHVTAGKFDDYWQWQHHGFFYRPQQSFYPSIGVFSTEFSLTVNAYAELWQHPPKIIGFDNLAPADVRDAIAAEAQTQVPIQYPTRLREIGEHVPEDEDEFADYHIRTMPYNGDMFVNYGLDHAHERVTNKDKPSDNFTIYTLPDRRPDQLIEDYSAAIASSSAMHFYNSSWAAAPTSIYQADPAGSYDWNYQPQTQLQPPAVMRTESEVASRVAAINDASPDAQTKGKKLRGPRKETLDNTFESLVQRRKAAKPKPQMSGRSNFTIDSEMAQRLFYACIVVKVLAGGSNQAVDWDVVEKLCAPYGLWESIAFKKRWEIMVEFHTETILIAEESFQEAFLSAFENEEWPNLDPTNLEDDDWMMLTDWAEENVAAPQIDADFKLPQKVQELHEAYDTSIRPRETATIGDELFNAVFTMQGRNEVVQQLDFSHVLQQPAATTEIAQDKDTQLYKSVTRACIATPDDVYDRDVATQLLSKLDNDRLLEASSELRRDKVVAHNNKGRLQEHRSYHLGEAYYDIGKRTGIFGRNVAIETFNLAVDFKKKLDVIFASERPEYIPTELIQDHEMMVLSELLFHKRVKLSPKLPPFNDKIGDPWPRISKWGFGHEGLFNKKKTDKEVYTWDIVYTPTTSYIPGIPTSNTLAATPIPRIPRGDDPDQARIPLWIDIHGDPIAEFWLKTIQAVVQGTAVRAGMTISEIARLFRGFLWEFEVEMVVKWLVQTGIATWHGIDIDELQKTSIGGDGLFAASHAVAEAGVGLVAKEWWWCLFDQKLNVGNVLGGSGTTAAGTIAQPG